MANRPTKQAKWQKAYRERRREAMATGSSTPLAPEARSAVCAAIASMTRNLPVEITEAIAWGAVDHLVAAGHDRDRAKRAVGRAMLGRDRRDRAS